MAEEEIGRETAAALRTTLQVAGLLAEHWNRRAEARARASTAQHEAAAREATARWHGERRTAETSLRTTGTTAWWRTANRSDITEAWCTARQWSPHSPLAASTEKRLTSQILERYGIDLTSNVPIDAPADPAAINHLLTRAAWHRAEIREDEPDLEAQARDAAAQQARTEALYALVAEHSHATNTGPDAADAGYRAAVAEAGLRGLGEPGAAWLREFDRAPHLAYARVLIAPEVATRIALHDSAERLHQIDNTPTLAGDERAARIAAELAVIEDLGEHGHLWLDAWRAAPETAYDRVLNNPHLQHDLSARETKEFGEQQRAADAALRGRHGKWFATAGRAEILDAWDTARTWREHSALAASTLDRLNAQILERFGVDLTGHGAEVEQVSEMIDRAAWRVAAAKMDTTALEAAHAETETQQRHERDHLYQAVAEHNDATTQYRAHGDNQHQAPTDLDPDRTRRAAAIGAAETRLRDLGPAGTRWLRDFDSDPHRAYARALVAPDSATRRQLHAAVQQLHDADLVGPTRTPRLDRDHAITAVEATGETGERWLNTWRTNPQAAMDRVLEDPYTATEITQAPTTSVTRKPNRRSNASRRPARGERAPRAHTETWTAADLTEARTWLGKHDPEWLAVRDWKLSNMSQTEYGRRSVHESIVDQYRRATHPDPAVRETARITGIADHNHTDRTTAIRTQLADRDVSPALQRIRMNLEQDNAVPLNAMVATSHSPDAGRAAAEPELELHREQEDLGQER